jgi:hypothetical protein
MVKMNHEITIVRGYGFRERYSSDPCPELLGEPLNAGKAMFFSFLGHCDVEGKPATARERIARIVEDAQDFVAKIYS